jgi:hypothetical protein
MTELRNQNPIKKRAHQILDEVRSGLYHSKAAINWALAVLGEPVRV